MSEKHSDEAIERVMREMYATFGTIYDEGTRDVVTFEDFQRDKGLLSDEDTYTFTWHQLHRLARAALDAVDELYEADEVPS